MNKEQLFEAIYNDAEKYEAVLKRRHSVLGALGPRGTFSAPRNDGQIDVFHCMEYGLNSEVHNYIKAQYFVKNESIEEIADLVFEDNWWRKQLGKANVDKKEFIRYIKEYLSILEEEKDRLGDERFYKHNVREPLEYTKTIRKKKLKY